MNWHLLTYVHQHIVSVRNLDFFKSLNFWNVVRSVVNIYNFYSRSNHTFLPVKLYRIIYAIILNYSANCFNCRKRTLTAHIRYLFFELHLVLICPVLKLPKWVCYVYLCMIYVFLTPLFCISTEADRACK